MPALRPARLHHRLLTVILLGLVLQLTACGGSSGSTPTVANTPTGNTGDDPDNTDDDTDNDGGDDSDGDAPQPVNLTWGETYQRDEEYPSTVNLPQQLITMDDGIQLAATVTLPADENGNPVSAQFPVIATFTGYNQFLSSSLFADPELVKRGYAYINVDMRGTGASQGSWQAFGQRDHDDIAALVTHIKNQPWSNGRIGMNGPSYMAITGLLAGASGDPAVEAIFAVVPMGDAYRDIVFSGGQVNAGFIPLWMLLVTGLGVVPSPVGLENGQPGYNIATLLQHLQGAATEFQVPVIAGALVGDEHKYDTEFWRIRSPLEKIDNITAPTFVVGGLNDIFQRGEPLIYEGLKERTTSKLLIGPWEHLGGSSGDGLPADGVPALGSLRLAWFDRYLKDMDTGAEDYPPVTQYYTGEERYVTAADWPHPDAQASVFYLHGQNALPLLGSLDQQQPDSDQQTTLLQTPVNGLCSASASQWTAGILGMVVPPCAAQDNVVNLLEAVYTSEPLEEAMAINGPITGQIWASTTALDTNITVRVSAVDENGIARPLTHGIQMASMNALDSDKSRFMNGTLVQPWHPFTAESQRQITPLEPFQVDVEVFPTSAVIQAGEKLRISVGSSDFPHGLSPLNNLLTSLLGALTIYSTPTMASRVNIPLVPTEALQ